jgi:methionyl-tRNA formyltransferase
VTVQELSKDRFDRGKTLAQKMVPLSSDATYLAMEPILARVGGELLLDLMLHFESGKVCTLPTFKQRHLTAASAQCQTTTWHRHESAEDYTCDRSTPMGSLDR